MLEESSVYQDIFQKGEQRGLQKGEQCGLQKGLQKGERRGLQKGERKLVLLLLEERFGKLSPPIRKQIERLSAGQLEKLGKALLHFKKPNELSAWLKQHAPERRNGA